MIQGYEYQVGNWIVDWETEEKYFQVEEIKKNKQGNIGCFYRNGSCWNIAPDGVELTEEILLKCPKDLVYPEWIKYLHDLQNWYYYNNNKKELHINL